MKQIPLVRKNNQLLLWGRINGSINIQFILDTGCSSMLLSKEVGDILFLKGNLVKSDVKGTLASSYGGVYTAQQKEISIRNLTLGKIKLKNVEASICDRYGGPSLLGMSALDKLDGYSITKDKLIIDDGNAETVTTTGKVEDHKPYKTRFKGCIKRIRKIREESGTEDYKFDYAKHVMLIYSPIQSCYPFLLDKKYALVSEVLEELQPLIKENLADDEENTDQKGAFITAYFNFYLASAYYGLERMEEALTYYDKAGKFFLRGSTILNEINEISRRIREKLKERDKDKPKVFAPAKTTTFEEDVQAYNLQQIDFEDHYYGNGETKSAYVGFQNFDAAYTFCRMNHKRLEVLRKDDGKWQRTGNIPTENLYYSNLKMEEGYKCYAFDSYIDGDLKKLTELLGDDKERIEQFKENAEKAKTALNSVECSFRDYPAVVLCEADLTFDALIKPGGNISWHGQELVLAAMDIEESVTKRLEEDVLAGRIIPCAFGQMPEDYTYLADKNRELKPFCEDDYAAKNDPENSRCLGRFIIYDDENCVGYGWRSTYDDKYWRWEGVEHSNIGGFPNTGDDTSLVNDHRICYWQLVLYRKEDENGIIHPEAF